MSRLLSSLATKCSSSESLKWLTKLPVELGIVILRNLISKYKHRLGTSKTSELCLVRGSSCSSEWILDERLTIWGAFALEGKLAVMFSKDESVWQQVEPQYLPWNCHYFFGANYLTRYKKLIRALEVLVDSLSWLQTTLDYLFTSVFCLPAKLS